MMTTTEILTGIKNWVTGKLTLKQDVINDLASIRSGAQAGATSVQPADILSYFDDAAYDSGTHRINFYHGQSAIAYIDASPFIIDGMVDDVRIENGYLVIDFNTASGKQDISIPLTDIFNPNNYYTKSETDSQLTQKQTEIDDLYARIGYYVCSTEGNVAAKTIVANNYTLGNGGSIKIKMTNANTVNNATLNINSTGAKALYYDGERASAKNSWEAGETVEVYYDGTSFYANNVAGGSGSGDGAFDVSAKYPTSGVDGGNTYTLEGALAVLNANLSASKKKGGMSIKFVLSSDNKYVQYRLMAQNFTTDTAQWQGVDDEPTAGSINLVESGGIEKKIGGGVIFNQSVSLGDFHEVGLMPGVHYLVRITNTSNSDCALAFWSDTSANNGEKVASYFLNDTVFTNTDASNPSIVENGIYIIKVNTVARYLRCARRSFNIEIVQLSGLQQQINDIDKYLEYPDYSQLFERGAVSIYADGTMKYVSSDKLVRTKEYEYIHLKVGDKVGLSDYSFYEFLVGYTDGSGLNSYVNLGWHSNDYTCVLDGYYVVDVRSKQNTVVPIEDVNSLFRIVYKNALGKAASDTLYAIQLCNNHFEANNNRINEVNTFVGKRTQIINKDFVRGEYTPINVLPGFIYHIIVTGNSSNTGKLAFWNSSNERVTSYRLNGTVFTNINAASPTVVSDGDYYFYINESVSYLRVVDSDTVHINIEIEPINNVLNKVYNNENLYTGTISENTNIACDIIKGSVVIITISSKCSISSMFVDGTNRNQVVHYLRVEAGTYTFRRTDSNINYIRITDLQGSCQVSVDILSMVDLVNSSFEHTDDRFNKYFTYGIYDEMRNRKNAYKLPAICLNSVKSSDDTYSTIKRVSQQSSIYSHMSQCLIHNDIVYISYLQNSSSGGESLYSDTSSLVLAVVPIAQYDNPQSYTYYTIGEKGDYCDELQAKSIFKDNAMCIVDNTLYITFMFITEEEDKARVFVKAFNLSNNTFTSESACTLDYNGNRVDFDIDAINSIYSDNGLNTVDVSDNIIEMVSQYSLYNEYYYATLVCGVGENNGMIVRTQDFVHFEYVSIIPFNYHGNAEVASIVFDSKLFVACRQHYGTPFLCLSYYDLRTNKWGGYSKISDGISRPWFYILDNKLYLVNTIDLSRKYTNIYSVSFGNYKDNTPSVTHIVTLNNIGYYWSFVNTTINNEEVIYFSSITQAHSVVLGLLRLSNYSESEVNNRLLELFNL